MENLVVNQDFWRGKRVLLTGHTGFKGSWLSLWLQAMEAQVHGFALTPPTTPNMFTVANVASGMASSEVADIRDADRLRQVIETVAPEIVFHLAAQALVRLSYARPAETYAVNIMGTVNLYESVRASNSVKAIVNVTSDKCYENREWTWGYRENEPMGGHDPYSSSKGCAELVTSAYRSSFFDKAGVFLASARAGNVIGGGDWATDRLVPDYFRARAAGQILQIRSPMAIRPWQHVLEPLSGYLLLAEKLYSEGAAFAEAWNFGPSDEDARSVRWIIEYLSKLSPDAKYQFSEISQPHEANCLKLDSSKARNKLAWQPRWHLQKALEKTLEWQQDWLGKEDMKRTTLEQIAEHQSPGQSR
ncbi:MAG: CDP-glucose 4,6-dehydratase [Desulfobulbaceae bacterium]|nr:CDP-glucose 4,6-dehydratase [Desulfobulbaceae bacterium]